MHLGRFHAVIESLVNHFQEKQIAHWLTQGVDQLGAYASTRSENHLSEFKANLSKLYQEAGPSDDDLNQPYAREIINELNLQDLFMPRLAVIIDEEIQRKSFDVNSLYESLSNIKTKLNEKITKITAIYDSFQNLGVEYQQVRNGESEVGFLLPREKIGNNVANLISEFSHIDKLARAVNELSGSDYEPKIVTISSSWWQIFIESGPLQIPFWVYAVERISALYKTSLEIKLLQKQLEEKNVSDKITKDLEASIQATFSEGIRDLAHEIRQSYSAVKDEARANELETQLRQGLKYLAKRISDGAQVEINVSLPFPKKQPSEEELQKNPALATEITAARARLEDLRNMRARAHAASSQLVKLDAGELPPMLEDIGEEEN